MEVIEGVLRLVCFNMVSNSDVIEIGVLVIHNIVIGGYEARAEGP